MKIAVLGSGAMGSVFGGLLAEHEQNVVLIDTWKQHIDAINKNGLHLEGIGGDRFINVKGVSSADEIKDHVDLVIVFVKSPFTESAVKGALHIIGENTMIMTLQNGLGNAEKIAEIAGSSKTIVGITNNGATLIEPGRVRHAGLGETVISPFDGKISQRIKEIAQIFTEAGLPTRVSDEVTVLVWDKLMVNVGINALTAVLKVPNGYLVEHASSDKLLEYAVKEAEKVCKAKGIQLRHDPVQHCRDVARATAANYSSMYQDVAKKRITEIDYINGAVVNEGRKLGIPTPVNETLVLLIKAIEEGY